MEKNTAKNGIGFLGILGNIIFFIFNLIPALSWLLTGIFWCGTILEIPLGIQCFKLAGLTAFPFGKNIIRSTSIGVLEVIGNIIWLFTFGILLALYYLILGLVLCITIIFIPFGKQYFKLAGVALLPFGCKVVNG